MHERMMWHDHHWLGFQDYRNQHVSHRLWMKEIWTVNFICFSCKFVHYICWNFALYLFFANFTDNQNFVYWKSNSWPNFTLFQLFDMILFWNMEICRIISKNRTFVEISLKNSNNFQKFIQRENLSKFPSKLNVFQKECLSKIH